MIVVDEQGNEYEATYPKRAKGLVKNGRARFVGENKICLARPPEQILEDNKMTDKKDHEIIESAKAAARSAKEFTDAYEAEMSKLMNDKETGQLTAKGIFTQLTVLQKQLTESSYTSLHHLSEAISAAVEDREDADVEISEQITDICDVFKTREETLRKLLDVYEKMYEDIKKGQDKPMKNENPGS